MTRLGWMVALAVACACGGSVESGAAQTGGATQAGGALQTGGVLQTGGAGPVGGADAAIDAPVDALPKNCIDQFGGGAPAVCCPDPAPDCRGKPDGYPGYSCVEKQNQFCSCFCSQGLWECAC